MRVRFGEYDEQWGIIKDISTPRGLLGVQDVRKPKQRPTLSRPRYWQFRPRRFLKDFQARCASLRIEDPF